jgi:hypothetical protein
MSVSESGYSTSDTVSVSEYPNHIFMMSISKYILSGIVDIIRIRIQIRTKYENKYDMSDMRPYPIGFHPYVHRSTHVYRSHRACRVVDTSPRF